MHRRILVGTRMTPDEAENFATIARLHGRSVAAELRHVAAEHVRATVDALNDGERQDDGPALPERPLETAADATGR